MFLSSCPAIAPCHNAELERKSGVKLNCPCPCRAQQLAKPGIVDACPKAGKIRVIERVEQIAAKLHFRPFMDWETLREP
jgi:hypothetical protein